MPFENSTHGVVTFTLNNLADRDNAYTDLSVCGEIYIDVHHFLLGYKSKTPPAGLASTLLENESSGTSTPTPRDPNPLRPRARPLHSVKHVQRIHSHPQAFGQTNAFLTTYLRGVDMLDASSTSKAAELASQDKTGATAAIAGEIAAEMFGLDVLARCIEDRDDNTTRFFIIRKGVEAKPPKQSSGDGGDDNNNKKTKSLVSFTVPHSSPGALAGVLDVFRKYGLNLTSINSLPSLMKPFQYLFFVEFEGSRFEDTEGKVKSAFDEVDKVAQGWRWLGSWERQR